MKSSTIHFWNARKFVTEMLRLFFDMIYDRIKLMISTEPLNRFCKRKIMQIS